MDTNFLAENTLQTLSPELHKLYTKCVAKADTLLVRYRFNFPEYTDHTLLHSIEVAYLSNYLISNRIDQMNAGELYILLMAALLHDVGMGLSPAEVKKYHVMMDTGEFDSLNPEASAQDFIREFHHDLGALFIRDNWRNYLKIPDEATAEAIAMIVRAHRVYDLEDRSLFPTDLKLSICDGPINMPYLAAVIRMADEMDISASRNLMLQYAGFIPKNSRSAIEFQKHRSVRSIFDRDRFIIGAETGDRKEYDELLRLCDKVEKTLQYCQHVVESCTDGELPIRFVANEVLFTGNDAPLKLELDQDGDTLTITLSGKLDTLTAPILEERLANSLGGAVKNLVLDFGPLKYVSSAGLRVILSAKKKMLQIQGDLLIRQASDEIMEIFKITGFDSMLRIESAQP